MQSSPGHDLYARNVEGHFCRTYAYDQQAGVALAQKWLYSDLGTTGSRRRAQIGFAIAGASVLAVVAFVALMSRRGWSVAEELRPRLVDTETSSDLEC